MLSRLWLIGAWTLPGCTHAIEPASRPGPPAVDPGELVVDDFEDRDLESELGLAWMVIADDVAGGASSGRVESATDGQLGVLRLIGDRRPLEARPIGFVGAWTAVGDDGRPRDLSAYAGLRLRARASAGDGFQISVRRAGAVTNFSAPIAIGPAWTEIDVRFASLRPFVPPGSEPARWNAADVTWVGVDSIGPDGAMIDVEVDRLSFYGGPPAERAKRSTAEAGSAVATVQLADASALSVLNWRKLAREPAGNASSPRLPDAVALDWATGTDGRVWFRVSLAAAPPERWLGVNVALDTDGDPDNGAPWWGQNSAFHFDHLVTAYLTRAERYWLGSVGMASADDVARQIMDATTSDVMVAVDRGRDAFLVGVPRDALPARGKVRLITTVGSSMINNDDLPRAGAVELDLPPGTR